jgi:hypothetical protein
LQLPHAKTQVRGRSSCSALAARAARQVTRPWT